MPNMSFNDEQIFTHNSGSTPVGGASGCQGKSGSNANGQRNKSGGRGVGRGGDRGVGRGGGRGVGRGGGRGGRRGGGGGSGRGGGGGGNQSLGYWDCNKCWNVGNFESRPYCYRCDAPRPAGVAVYGGAAAEEAPVAGGAAKVTSVAAEVVAVAGGAAKVTPVAGGGGASGATPGNTWAALAANDCPDYDEMRRRDLIKKREEMVALVRDVYGDNTPKDTATVLRLYSLLRGPKPVMTGPVKVQYTEFKTRAEKSVWYTYVSPTGTFVNGPYTRVQTLDEHDHIGGAAAVYLFHTFDEEERLIMVFMHEKEENESPEEEKKAASKVRNALLDGVTNGGIQHRCCTYTVYDRDGNENHLPQAFADLANKAGFDLEKVRFTTLVLTPQLFEEYIAVVDGNIATRHEQKQEQQNQWDFHKTLLDRVDRLGGFQCSEFPSQVLLEDLGDVPKGTIKKHVFRYIVNALPPLPGLRTKKFDLALYDGDKIIVLRLPNLGGSTPPLNEEWPTIVQDWYTKNMVSIHKQILTDIRTYNKERRVKNAAEREKRSHLFGDVSVSFGAGDGKGSHRGKVARSKTMTQMKTGAPAPVTAKPTKTTQSTAVSDSDFERLISLLKRKWNADEKRFSDEEDTWRKQTLRSLTTKQQTDMRNRLR